MSIDELLDYYSEKTGWNDQSKLDLCIEYIENQQDNLCFEDFIKRKCEDELNPDEY